MLQGPTPWTHPSHEEASSRLHDQNFASKRHSAHNSGLVIITDIHIRSMLSSCATGSYGSLVDCFPVACVVPDEEKHILARLHLRHDYCLPKRGHMRSAVLSSSAITIHNNMLQTVQ